MHVRRILILLSAFPLLLAGSARLEAQKPSFRGTFVRDEAASTPMDKIVSDGMARLSSAYRLPLIRTAAKRRLMDTNHPYAWVRIDPTGNTVNVRTPEYSLTTPQNGQLENWERKEGDPVDVTTRMTNGRMEQTFEAEDGRRTNVLTISPDGNTLTMNVSVVSPKLSSPLTYKMVYRRDG